MLNKKYLLLILIIFIISILPRALEIFNASNYYFGTEQAIEYLVTKNIVINHQIVLIAHQGGFGGLSKNPGFNYLLIIPFVLANGDPFGGRVFMMIVGVLTVLAAFILTKKMFSLRIGALTSFFIAISPILISYSSSISPPFIIPLLTVFLIYFLHKIFQGNKNYIPLLVFTVGLMTNFETATAVVLIVLLIFTGSFCLIKKIIPYRYYIISFMLFLITLIPIIIFDIQHNYSNTKGLMEIIHASGMHSANNLFTNIGSTINARITVFSWNFISTFSINLFIWLTIFFIILIGVILFIKDKKIDLKERYFVACLAFIPLFTFALLFIYPSNTVQQWWFTDLSIVYCFLLGITSDYFLKKKNFRIIIFVILFILSLAFIKRSLFVYKTQFAYPPNTYIKEENAIDYIFADAKNKNFGISILSNDTNENYDYLIWWKGYTKYHYQPYRQQKGLYYIIILPNFPLKLNSNDLRKGNLIKSVKLANGFIVEKRLVK